MQGCHKNDRNGVDLTEAEEIKKRWQENTGGLYKKDLNDPESHALWVCAVITHQQTKLVEVTEFQLSYFKC